MKLRRCLAAVAAASAALALAACGSDASGSRPDLVVSAASSLERAFTTYGDEFKAARVRLSFAGSDDLAAQIRQGVRPDVFASANTTLPDQLHAAGLVGRPTVFAGNRLVIAVPTGATKVRSLGDLAKHGVTIAMGSPSVPVGSYTRKVLSGLPAAQEKAILANVRSNEPDVAGVVGKLTKGAVDGLDALRRPGATLVIGAEGVPVGDYTRSVLARLGPAKSKAILANVRSNEPDVKGIVGKLTQGAADAGFVYASDVKAASGKLRAIDLPQDLQPQVAYGVAVVKGAKHPEQAKEFVDGLIHGDGRKRLDAAGVVAASRQPDAAEAFVDDLLSGGCHDALIDAGFGEP